MEPLQKRLPSSLTIQKLKALCRRAFGLDLDLQILHFRLSGDGFPTELLDDHHSLAYYGVGDGAEILMNEVDLVSQKNEEEKARKDFDQRMAQQEGEINAMQELQRDLRQKGVM